MTIEEFGQKIKEKYPVYSDISDAEVGQKTIDKYPEYKDLISSKNAEEKVDPFLAGHPILKGISDFLGTTGLGKGLAQSIFFNFTPEGKDLLKTYQEGKITEDEFNNVIGGIATQKEILGSAAQTGLSTFALGQTPLTSGKTIVGQGTKKFLSSAGVQALKSGLITGGIGAAGAYAQNKPISEVGKSGALGFGLGAGASSLVSLGKLALSGIPKLLSIPSEVPKEVLEKQFQNPQVSAEALRQIKSQKPEGLLKEIQGAVRELRKDLSDSYEQGKNFLVDQFSGKRFGFNGKEINLLNKISESYPSRISLPSALEDLSLKEGLELYKSLNSIKAIGSDPSQVIARDLKDIIRKKLVDNFGGSGAGVDIFLKNYATSKTIHDSIDSLVRAYKTGNPRLQSGALSALKSVFNENKDSYLKALQDFEKVTGISFVDRIGAMKLLPVAPKRTPFGLDDIFRYLILPLTSPRIVGLESRAAGRISAAERAIPQVIKGIGKITGGQISK